MKETGEPKKTFPKRFYLKWPWNVIVYIVLAVVLRVFAIPLILLIMWWNKKQQPDGPEEGCCLRRTRGRLTGLIPATLLMAGGALCLYFFYLGQTLPGEVERLDDQMRVVYHLCPFLGAGMILIGIFLAYRSLRDALYPEKSALAQSIRDQLPYPDEAPPVKELFAMVDRDLKENGAWFGKLGVGREWVLGDVVSRIPRIRGVFSRVERQTHHAGKRTTVTYIYELWIVDDCQRRQVTSLKSKQELEEAMDCLRRRAPAALFGAYDSKEYQDLVCVKEDMQQYTQEQAYRKRAARVEEQNRKEQEGLAQNQVLTLPDGSVTSRITPEDLRQLLLRPSRTGEAAPFQLVPGVPFQGEGHTFSRLACLPGGGQEPVRILLEEYSGTPGAPGRYAWTRDVSTSEAETVLRGWLRGEVPSLDGWTRMERTGRTWRPLDGGNSETTPVPPQPHPDWPWSLNIGGGLRSNPAWQDIESALRELTQEENSFLILEQEEPGNPEHYWFIQCAMARRGPDRGRYFVEIGASSRAHRLWERMVPDVQAAVEFFFTAYQQRSVDGSGFRETEF